jgi:hypothetical protein
MIYKAVSFKKTAKGNRMFLFYWSGKRSTGRIQKIPFNTSADSVFMKISKNAEKWIILLA